MSRMSPEHIARVRAESERLLRDPPARPEPAPVREPPPIVFEDDVAKWKREADEADALRAAAKAELRRQVDNAAEAGWAVIGARFDQIEQRLDEIERTVAGLYEAVPAAAQFSSATVGRMAEFESLATSLSATLDTLRAVQDRETKFLRDRLAASEAAGARESAFLSRQLTEARREIDALVGQLNRERDQEQTNRKLTHLTESVNNVLSFAQKVPEDGAA